MSSAFTSNRRSLSPFWLLAILSGLNLFNYLDRYVVCQVVEPIRLSFGLTDRQEGQLNTAFMLGYFLTAPVFGYLGDRMTRKWLIAAGIFVWSLGTVLSGLATGFGSLLGYRALVGLGEASYATISPSLISDAYSPARRNNALTIFYVAIPVGAALGYLVGSQISTAWGWRYAFVVAGLPGLLLAVSLLPFREQERGQAEHRQREAAADQVAQVDQPVVDDITGLEAVGGGAGCGAGDHQLPVMHLVGVKLDKRPVLG